MGGPPWPFAFTSSPQRWLGHELLRRVLPYACWHLVDLVKMFDMLLKETLGPPSCTCLWIRSRAWRPWFQLGVFVTPLEVFAHDYLLPVLPTSWFPTLGMQLVHGFVVGFGFNFNSQWEVNRLLGWGLVMVGLWALLPMSNSWWSRLSSWGIGLFVVQILLVWLWCGHHLNSENPNLYFHGCRMYLASSFLQKSKRSR